MILKIALLENPYLEKHCSSCFYVCTFVYILSSLANRQRCDNNNCSTYYHKTINNNYRSRIERRIHANTGLILHIMNACFLCADDILKNLRSSLATVVQLKSTHVGWLIENEKTGSASIVVDFFFVGVNSAMSWSYRQRLVFLLLNRKYVWNVNGCAFLRKMIRIIVAVCLIEFAVELWKTRNWIGVECRLVARCNNSLIAFLLEKARQMVCEWTISFWNWIQIGVVFVCFLNTVSTIDDKFKKFSSLVWVIA